MDLDATRSVTRRSQLRVGQSCHPSLATMLATLALSLDTVAAAVSGRQEAVTSRTSHREYQANGDT